MLTTTGTGRRLRLARVVASLMLIPLLSSCAGVIAIPLVAGGVLLARDKVRVRAATQVTPVTPATEPADIASTGAPRVTLTDLHELPPPTPVAVANAPESRWSGFFTYALEQSTPPEGSAQLQSALLAAGGALDEPRRRDCPSAHPAVVVDLDAGETAFVPQGLAPAPPQVAEGFARLRDAGVTVLWIADLPAARVGEVAGALRASGLDPAGQDQLLLIRDSEDRKQALREQANQDVCIVAIAGDRRGDFDELFDYLRDPAGAIGLEPMIGNGWFLVSAPTEADALEGPVSAPADRSSAPD